MNFTIKNNSYVEIKTNRKVIFTDIGIICTIVREFFSVILEIEKKRSQTYWIFLCPTVNI